MPFVYVLMNVFYASNRNADFDINMAPIPEGQVRTIRHHMLVSELEAAHSPIENTAVVWPEIISITIFRHRGDFIERLRKALSAFPIDFALGIAFMQHSLSYDLMQVGFKFQIRNVSPDHVLEVIRRADLVLMSKKHN